MSGGLKATFNEKDIMTLRMLQEQGHLNLSPGFQRKSVWSMADRRKLIQTVLDGFPIPSIFLYRREDDGALVYDVLDGKQRLETIFMFLRARGFKRSGFGVRYQFPEDEKSYFYEWKDLERWGKVPNFLSYTIPIVEVDGEFGDIVDLFVRINSTGKALTSAEKRSAKYYDSPFLKAALSLAKRFRTYLTSQQIVRAGQIARMKDVELMSELLASVNVGGPINKKAAVDRAVGNTPIHGQTLKKVSAEVTRVLNLLKTMFPDLRSTRFRNIAEFYTLFMVVWEMHHQKLILTDRKRNMVAEKLLRRLSNGVDQVRQMQVHLRTGRRVPRLYADYLLTVQQSTDTLAQRKRRAEIVRGIFGGLFARKDTQRIFSSEQRRLLWNSEERKKCSQCGRLLDWVNFQVDHVKAHATGGRTTLSNAALICSSCNASKGAGKKARK